MSLLPLLLLWLNLALSQEQWRLLHADGSVTVAWGAKPELPRGGGAPVVSAWAWSGRHAPRRVAASRLGLDKFPDDNLRLSVQVARRSGGRLPDDLRLYAAPSAMWDEVPEASLPSWPVPRDGRIAIPVEPGHAWRLRVAGRGEGSWWVEVRPGQRSAFLTTAPATGIDLAVLSSAGKPVGSIDGFLTEAAARGGTLRSWARLRGETGELVAPGLPDEADVALQLLKPGSAPAFLRGRPSVLPHELRLPAGGELTGRLVDRGGAPVAGATIEAEFFVSPDRPQIMKSGARSGVKGEWRVPGLPAGKIAWSVRAPGRVPLAETVEIEAGARFDVGTRALEPGTTLALRVVDDTGAPVPGAEVQAGPGLPAATADGQGVAHLSGLPVAPLSLKGSAPRYLTAAVRLNPPFPAEPRLRLPRAFTLIGRFVDPAGAAILRGSVRVDSRTCQREEGLREGGRFELDLPQDGPEAQLILRSPGTQELRLGVTPGPAGELRDLGDLQAPAGLAVTGRVVGEGARPVAGARIWTTRQGPDGPAVAWAARDLLQASTGEDGRFRLSGLLPAPAILRVEAAGSARAQIALPLERQEGDGALDVGDIALSEGATLRVHLDARHRETPGAVARADLGNRWLEPDLLTAEVWNGEAVLPNVPAGKVTVTVLADRRLLCERVVAVPESGELEVECSRPALTVTGRVQVGGVPARSGALLWQPPALDVPGRIDTVVSPGGLRQQQVVGAGRPSVDVPVGSDGRFQTADLVPGRWQVLWVLDGSSTGSVAVDIPEVERFETVLPFAGRVVAGTVLDRDGKPAEGARVRELGSGALAFAGADGSFSLAGLPPGKAMVQAQRQDETSPVQEVKLEGDRAPEPLRLVLGDRKSPAVAVQVGDRAGRPVPAAFVFFEEEGKGVRLVTTAADGRATVALEAPLPLRVRAAAFAGGVWGFGSWVSREEALDGLPVSLQGVGSLVVQTARRQGSPRVTTESGWDLSWLLRLLGAPPALAAGQPLQLAGLPAGLYKISLDSISVDVPVQDDKVGQGRIE